MGVKIDWSRDNEFGYIEVYYQDKVYGFSKQWQVEEFLDYHGIQEE